MDRLLHSQLTARLPTVLPAQFSSVVNRSQPFAAFPDDSLSIIPPLSLPYGLSPPPPLPAQAPPSPTGAAQASFRPPTPPPQYTLFNAVTVADAWREWIEGIGGNPPLEKLQRRWGHRL